MIWIASLLRTDAAAVKLGTPMCAVSHRQEWPVRAKWTSHRRARLRERLQSFLPFARGAMRKTG